MEPTWDIFGKEAEQYYEVIYMICQTPSVAMVLRWFYMSFQLRTENLSRSIVISIKFTCENNYIEDAI